MALLSRLQTSARISKGRYGSAQIADLSKYGVKPVQRTNNYQVNPQDLAVKS